jgi:hypothetical protein
VGISVASASTLRTGLVIVCAATLLCLALKRVCRRVAKSKVPAPAQFPGSETTGLGQ